VVGRGIGHCVKHGKAGGSCQAIAGVAIVAMLDRKLKPKTGGRHNKHRLELGPSQLSALIAHEREEIAAATP
jgi:hypothetical protein